MRRTVVVVLEKACEVVDHLWFWPPPFRWIARWQSCRLANLSDDLDQRWNTGVWEDLT
jgi:hypothetical protein